MDQLEILSPYVDVMIIIKGFLNKWNERPWPGLMYVYIRIEIGDGRL
jgi:hypothetical protein